MINKSIKDSLRKTFQEFADAYTKAVEDSYNAQLQNLKPGDQAPAKRIMGVDEREAFRKLSSNYREQARKILESARDQIRAEMVKAPKADAVSFITLLGARTTLTRAEVDAAIEAYGDNYQAYKTIADIARKHEIFLPAPALDEDIEYINAQINSLIWEYSIENAEAGGTSPARQAFVKWMDD